MISNKRSHSIRVGDETYSLIVTEEDIEKRKLDKELARKLSMETIRRRKAIEDKKKLAEEREIRKRELELQKRHQRQIEATERYQRAHLSARERKNAQLYALCDDHDFLHGTSNGGYYSRGYSQATDPSVALTTQGYNFQVDNDENGVGSYGYLQKALDNLYGDTSKMFSTNLQEVNMHPSASSMKISNSGTNVPKTDTPQGQLPVSYYVKAYRPWSANVTTGQNRSVQYRTNVAAHTRPHSAYEPRANAAGDTSLQNGIQGYKMNNFSSGGSLTPVKHYLKMMSNSLPQYEASHLNPYHTRNRWLEKSLSSTTATPITTTFNGKDENKDAKGESTKDPSRPVLLLARQVIPSSPASVTKPTPYPSATTTETVTSVVSDPAGKENVNSLHSNSTSNDEKCSEKPRAKNGGLKGILRTTSKYDRRPGIHSSLSCYPVYQSAGLARDKWVNGIAKSASTMNETVQISKLEKSARETEPKIVRWHQVQYNDGTSSALDDIENVVKENPTVTTVTARNLTPSPPVTSPKTNVRNSPRSRSEPSVNKGKPPSPPRNAKGNKGKGAAKRRKLKPAKEIATKFEPHPPQTKAKQLSISTVENFSIDGVCEAPSHEEYVPASQPVAQPLENMSILSLPKKNIIFHPKRREAWGAPENDEPVTFDTLKSGGNRSSTTTSTVVNKGNHVTIHVVENENPYRDELDRSAQPGQISLNRTPTDKEICLLWDKVRFCLSQSRDNAPPLMRTMSATERIGSGNPRVRRRAVLKRNVRQVKNPRADLGKMKSVLGT